MVPQNPRKRSTNLVIHRLSVVCTHCPSSLRHPHVPLHCFIRTLRLFLQTGGHVFLAVVLGVFLSPEVMLSSAVFPSMGEVFLRWLMHLSSSHLKCSRFQHWQGVPRLFYAGTVKSTLNWVRKRPCWTEVTRERL